MSRIKDMFKNFMGALADAMASRYTTTYGPRVYTRQNLGKDYGLGWRTVGQKRCKGPRGGVYNLILRVPYSQSKTYRGDPGYACNKRLKEKRV